MNVYDKPAQPPNITRARGWRLYTEQSLNGRCRFVDLWQANGAALFGHKPAGFVKTLKNAAERGLFAPLPSRDKARLDKALSRLFPARVFYYSLPAAHCPLPAVRYPLYRPFSGAAGEAVLKEPVFYFMPPSPLGLLVLAALPEAAALINEQAQFERNPLPPILLACATQAVWTLINHPERGKLNFKNIDAALNANPAWRREGIYLFYEGTESRNALFARFLDAGFLIPENSNHPIILPGELSAGEEKKLILNLRVSAEIPR